MKLFLNGGGSGQTTASALKKFAQEIDGSKKILYIPLAMEENKYDSCYEWIQEELKNINIQGIDMLRSKDDLENKDLSPYTAIFIGGGNTYKLLKDLKESKIFINILNYLSNDGIVWGGSAGAIIFGESIETCKYSDENKVELTDLKGFNLVNGYSILCHYTNQSDEQTDINTEYLLELSSENKIMALPEETTLYINNNKIVSIDNKPIYVFENNEIKRK